MNNNRLVIRELNNYQISTRSCDINNNSPCQPNQNPIIRREGQSLDPCDLNLDQLNLNDLAIPPRRRYQNTNQPNVQDLLETILALPLGHKYLIAFYLNKHLTTHTPIFRQYQDYANNLSK